MFPQKNLARKGFTHWGWVTHICVGNLTIIGSDNGLSPGRRQAITWTNVGILLIGPLGKNFIEMFIEIHTFSLKKIHLKMSSGKWRPFCLGLNVSKDRLSCRLTFVLAAIQFDVSLSSSHFFIHLRSHLHLTGSCQFSPHAKLQTGIKGLIISVLTILMNDIFFSTPVC